MSKREHWTRRMAMAVVPIVFGSTAKASEGGTPADVDRPFSEHRLALQLSDRDPAKESLVLSVAFNMLATYDVDRISIEIIAFAGGIDLLRADSANRALVDSLVVQGVVFGACGNTIETVERETGHPFPLNPKARRVQAGVARILNLVEAGYTLVRP